MAPDTNGINPKEYIIIVDFEDNIIGNDTWDFVHQNGYLHREGAVIVRNFDYEILLQEGAKYGTRSFSAGGQCIWDEEYPETVVREGFEELGVLFPRSELKEIGKLRLNYGNGIETNNAFLQIYGMETNLGLEDFKIDRAEVKSIEYMSIEEVRKRVNEEIKEAKDGVLKKPYFSIPFRSAFEQYDDEIMRYVAKSKERLLI